MSAHERDGASAQGLPIAALERENELLRQELAAAKERERCLQNQIDQIQQRLLPPPRQGIIERIADLLIDFAPSLNVLRRKPAAHTFIL